MSENQALLKGLQQAGIHSVKFYFKDSKEIWASATETCKEEKNYLITSLRSGSNAVLHMSRIECK